MTDFDLDELEELTEVELRFRFERGDFVARKDIKTVKKILKKYEKEAAFIERCEKASISAALVSQRRSLTANIIAVAALLVSISGFFIKFIYMEPIPNKCVNFDSAKKPLSNYASVMPPIGSSDGIIDEN